MPMNDPVDPKGSWEDDIFTFDVLETGDEEESFRAEVKLDNSGDTYIITDKQLYDTLMSVDRTGESGDDIIENVVYDEAGNITERWDASSVYGKKVVILVLVNGAHD
jgi:hypothetical protein